LTVEKLTVKFVSKDNQTANQTNGEKGFFKGNVGDVLERAVSTTKRFIQSSFKNGYETASQRLSDLGRFNAKATTTETPNNPLSDNSNRAMQQGERSFVSEKMTELKSQTQTLGDDKEIKRAKTSIGNETTHHQGEFKSAKAATEGVMKNEPATNVRNLEQVYQKIKDMSQLMARQQTRTELATIKLNPPELGRVSLEVVKEGNKISILMQVETKEAQEILNKNSGTLAARLVTSGFELQKVTVQMEKYEEQGNNQTNQNGQENSEQQQNEEQERTTDNEYGYDEEYSFADLLKGGIEENAG